MVKRPIRTMDIACLDSAKCGLQLLHQNQFLDLSHEITFVLFREFHRAFVW